MASIDRVGIPIRWTSYMKLRPLSWIVVNVARHDERLRGAATRGRTGFEWGKYSDNAAWLRDRALRLPIAEEDVEADDRAPGRKRDVD